VFVFSRSFNFLLLGASTEDPLLNLPCMKLLILTPKWHTVKLCKLKRSWYFLHGFWHWLFALMLVLLFSSAGFFLW